MLPRSLGLVVVVLPAVVVAMASPAHVRATFDRDCRDFATHQEAQAYFESRGGSARNNVDNLDADHDGIACELLPRGVPLFTMPTPTRRPTTATRVPTTVRPTPTARVASTVRPTPMPRRTTGATTSRGDDAGGDDALALWTFGAVAIFFVVVVWLKRLDRSENEPMVPDSGNLPPLRLSSPPPTKHRPAVQTAAPPPRAIPPQSVHVGYNTTTMPYRDYLRTSEWTARRTAALRRAGYRCQVCNRRDRLDVHHRTYERRGREAPEDLLVLCRDCHDRYHDRLPRLSD